MARLDNQLAEIISHLTEQSRSMLTPTSQGPQGADQSTVSNDDNSSSILTANTTQLRLYRQAFESTLNLSRPYRRIMTGSMISLASSQRKGTRWSLFSGGSNTSVFSLAYSGINLKDVPDISGIVVPVGTADLYNANWYDTKRSIRPPPSPTAGGRLLLPVVVPIGRVTTSGSTRDVHRREYTGITPRGRGVIHRAGPSANPLHLAVEAGEREVVERLLDRGANIGAVNAFSYTALHLAA